MDLDPSLAATALWEMWPGFRELDVRDADPVISALAKAMTEANPPDRWEWAKNWIRERYQLEALAAEDGKGAPYVVPMNLDMDFQLALAIARSAHPSRVLANTMGYRYGRFTEVGDGEAVDVTMMGSHIARFHPNAVEAWTCGWATPTTTQALSVLVSTGWFYTDGGVIKYRSWTAPSERPDTPIKEGASYHYNRKVIK